MISVIVWIQRQQLPVHDNPPSYTGTDLKQQFLSCMIGRLVGPEEERERDWRTKMGLPVHIFSSFPLLRKLQQQPPPLLQQPNPVLDLILQ